MSPSLSGRWRCRTQDAGAFLVAVLVRRLQALRARGMPGELPDGRDHPNRIRLGLRAARICNGCGYCVVNCPFGVIDRREEDGRAWKCTLCYDRLKEDMTPACAKACPTESIHFGDLEQLREHGAARVNNCTTRRARGLSLWRRQEDQPGTEGLNAFFLLVDKPEVYNLPPDPVVPTKKATDGLEGHGARRGRHCRGSIRLCAVEPAGEFRWTVTRRGSRTSDERMAEILTRHLAAIWREVPRRSRRSAEPELTHLASRVGLIFPVTLSDPSYYERPLLKEPVWGHEIPLYYFIGGAAGAALALAAAAKANICRSLETLIREAAGLASWAASIGGVLLMLDLGRPSRFCQHAARVSADFADECGRVDPFGVQCQRGRHFRIVARPAGVLGSLGRLIRLLSGLAGRGLATYTGVLVSNSTIPLWQERGVRCQYCSARPE